ncbi:MAG: peptide-methionine (S)-S-oxide reductase MsrA [Planctomycetota bacterium]
MNRSKPLWVLLCLSVCVVGCAQNGTEVATEGSQTVARTPRDPATLSPTGVAIFAGGCFWCMEGGFEELDGVASVLSGYTGGALENPTYEQVCSNTTGHTEAVEVRYDPSVVSYETLLEVFWRQIDPTSNTGQFADQGSSYRPAIFYHDAAQKAAAERSKAALQASGRFSKPIVTPIEEASKFWVAEGYHQDYYKTNTGHYKRYRRGSGRASFLERAWGSDIKYTPPSAETKSTTTQPATSASARYTKPSRAEIKKMLTQQQFYVTQEDGTERPFRNEFWDNKKPGLYVDVVTGEPLFSSRDKFKSGTGWPSFTRPIASDALQKDVDYKLGYARNEVRSKIGDSHLGHVFEDGPAPTGLRYCINSAALRFIPVERLVEEGYGHLASEVPQK